MENKEFKYVDSYSNSHSITISSSDFELVQKDKKIHDVKFEGKPTTFFKDSLRRFVKNKSSVVGGCILGLIILTALIGPLCSSNVDAYNIDKTHTNANFGMKGRSLITPKLFNAGTGWWDGTIKKTGVVYDQVNNEPAGYPARACSELTTYSTYTTIPSAYNVGGQIILTNSSGISGAEYYNNCGDFYSYAYDFDFASYDYTISYSFYTIDTVKGINEGLGITNDNLNNYQDSEYRISVITLDSKGNKTYYPLTGDVSSYKATTGDFSDGFISDFSNSGESKSINVSEIMKGYGVDSLEGASINIDVARKNEGNRGAIIIGGLDIDSTTDPNKEELDKRDINDASQTLCQEEKVSDSGNVEDQYLNPKFWKTTKGSTGANAIKSMTCDFTYDQYEDIFGNATLTLEAYQINTWVSNGYIKFTPGTATDDPEELASRFTILTDDCPIVELISQTGNAKYDSYLKEYYGFTITAVCKQYKIFGYSSMPRFIFGTDYYGRDFFKTIFTSLRTSLLIAFGVSLINIAFGLCWGAISGYYGGWTDIAMERFCDILGGVPSVAIITLCILYLNNDMIAFCLSMFLTGWMGVAGRTRTQFYRYKGREYVLASRSLGAKDGRLIFRHILPNSLGTIITSSILMIPSVIYSEASIAYLNLGLSGQFLFGVILSENRNYFDGYTVYLLVIPTMIMLFLLISFNLFGNGLRDAFNPQLKGSE